VPSGILDGKQHVADEHICSRKWSGAPAGQNFRCALCGHKFKPGDTFRFVLTNTKAASDAKVPGGNPFVCASCDGINEDVYSRLVSMQCEWDEIKNRFWWFMS
jgi:hypothetical protein